MPGKFHLILHFMQGSHVGRRSVTMFQFDKLRDIDQMCSILDLLSHHFTALDSGSLSNDSGSQIVHVNAAQVSMSKSIESSFK